MKNEIMIMAAALALAASCTKNESSSSMKEDSELTGKEICFATDGLDVNVDTKVAEVTMENLESFNVAAVSAGSPETFTWSVVAHRSGNRYLTGKYWPVTNPTYRFYASNCGLTINEGVPCTVVDESMDAVCGAMTTPTFQAETTTIVMRHIFSRIGSISINSEQGYELSNISIKLTEARIGGKYNLKTYRWFDCTSQSNMALQIGNNDILVVPGTTAVEVGYTMTKGDYSYSFTSTSNVTLMEGKICDLNLTVTKDPAVPVRIAVSLAPWESRQLPVTLQ